MRDRNAKTETNHALIEEMKVRQEFKAAENIDPCNTCGKADCPGSPRFKGICPVISGGDKNSDSSKMRQAFIEELVASQTPKNEWGCEAMEKLGIIRGYLYEIRGMLTIPIPADDPDGEIRELIDKALEETKQPQPCKDGGQ